jgi:hypothetical protein
MQLLAIRTRLSKDYSQAAGYVEPYEHPPFDKLSMNSFLSLNLSIGCEIEKIIKQYPNGT